MIKTKKLFKSFGYAFEGIKYVLEHDQNLIIHFIATIIVSLMSIYFRLSAFEVAILFLTILVVVCAEMINSAIEKVIDLIKSEHHISAKIAKDVASGMVLVTAVGAIGVGILVFLPYIIDLF